MQSDSTICDELSKLLNWDKADEFAATIKEMTTVSVEGDEEEESSVPEAVGVEEAIAILSNCEQQPNIAAKADILGLLSKPKKGVLTWTPSAGEEKRANSAESLMKKLSPPEKAELEALIAERVAEYAAIVEADENPQSVSVNVSPTVS